MGGEVKLEPTDAEIDRAAWAWRNDKLRETDGSDQAYFRHNWPFFPGLRAYVAAEIAGRAALAQGGEDAE